MVNQRTLTALPALCLVIWLTGCGTITKIVSSKQTLPAELLDCPVTLSEQQNPVIMESDVRNNNTDLMTALENCRAKMEQIRKLVE